MLFTEPTFLFLFLPLFLGLQFVLRGHESRNVLLLVASLASYATAVGIGCSPPPFPLSRRWLPASTTRALRLKLEMRQATGIAAP